MAIRFISLRCPECGATLSIEEGRTQAFCTYCGAKVLISNDNEFVYRDEAEIRKAEARIKEAEYAHSVRMKELEIDSTGVKKSSLGINLALALGALMILVGIVLSIISGENENNFAVTLLISLGIFLVFVLGCFKLGEIEERNNAVQLRRGRVQFSAFPPKYSQTDYRTLLELLKVSGFQNIHLVNLRDINRNNQNSVNMLWKVDKVTINGQRAEHLSFYEKNDLVVITYHGYNDRS